MKITPAAPSDLSTAVGSLVAAFAEDPITGYLLEFGPSYRERLTKFFSLLMRARFALSMPVIVAKSSDGIQGAAMGDRVNCRDWPRSIQESWKRFERSVPGLAERLALYSEIATRYQPPISHYYLRVIGITPDCQGVGIGSQLLKSFCDLSANDPLSEGVYLETAKESNLRFYERAGFADVGHGSLGNLPLWYMYLPHRPR